MSHPLVRKSIASLATLRPVGAVASLLGMMCFAAAVLAQGVPTANPYDQTRTSSFTYFDTSDGPKNGLLRTEVIEPLNPQLCVVTTYDYDNYGNKQVSTSSNCGGAGGNAVFATRSSSGYYQAQVVSIGGVNVTVPAGAFATSGTNALNQGESHTFDPRFGNMLSLTGPNSLTTSWEVDDLGRNVREIRSDGTRSVTYYCFIPGRVSDLSSNSAQCPTPLPSEVPNDAVSFVHTESRDNTGAAGAKNGPFVRTYSDRAGRKIRTVSEAFDGAGQPGGPGRLIVQDTDYSPYGPQTVATQPYFLDTGSSLASGWGPYGMSMTTVDFFGRPAGVFVADAATSNGTSGSLGGSQPSVAFGNRRSVQASVTTIRYAGLTTVTINDKGEQRTEERNVDGKVVRVTDALGAQLAHQHDAFGNLIATKDALQNQILVSYDLRGRKVAMADPDTGSWQYDYDAMSQLTWQQSSNQRSLSQVTTMMYDVLGRMTVRTEPEFISTWNYDRYADGSACSYGSGKLCESNASNGVNHKTSYDGLGRPVNTRTTVSGGPSFASSVAYDTVNGRILSQTYPTGLQVRYSYTGNGYLGAMTLATSASVAPLPPTPGGPAGAGTTLPADSPLWMAIAYNAWGKVEQQRFGNGVISNATFESLNGRVVSYSAGLGGNAAVVNQGLVWDSLNRIAARSDANGDGITGAVTDAFAYDSIGRLQSYTVSAPAIPGLARSVTLQYNALGMLLNKSDVGNLSYGAQNTAGTRPHALMSVAGVMSSSYGYDANGNVISSTGGAYRNIAYTSFGLPDGNQGVRGPAGGPQYSWQYDENHQRVKEVRLSGGVTRTTWYVHPDNQGGLGFESESSTAASVSMNRHYLSVSGVPIGVLVSSGPLPVLAAGQLQPAPQGSMALVKVEYWHRDYLGSLIATTDHTGAVTQRYAYDPFGKRRSASGTYDSFGTLVVDWTPDTNWGTDRGFTGHEHLDDIGIVHMNGRLFDPMLGRFIQGDPLIQGSGNLQNFDRYGYCYNNPLTCTDPSGLGFASIFRFLDPLGYALHKLATHSAIGRAYIQYEIYAGSSWCGAYVYVCIGAGEAINASLSGYSNSQALRAGVVAGATAYANDLVGSYFQNPFLNVAAHAVVGCASSSAGGGSCRSGAIGAAAGSAYDVSGLHYEGTGSSVVNFVASSAVGGIASVATGGSFRDGAKQAAYSYIFNCLLHECLAQGRDAERTFVDYLNRSGITASAGLEFNKWSDSAGNFFWGRPDIFSPSLNMVWDVKPDSAYGWASGPEQIARYTSTSGYDAGTAAPLFGGQSSITLTGAMNRYEYSYGPNGLVIYHALDLSPMERTMQQFLNLMAVSRARYDPRTERVVPILLPPPVLPLPIP